LEAWFPFEKEFQELVSYSNCTDYQSCTLEIRLRTGKNAADAKASGTFIVSMGLCVPLPEHFAAFLKTIKLDESTR
jgi:seryl-tRNA synthetase